MGYFKDPQGMPSYLHHHFKLLPSGSAWVTVGQVQPTTGLPQGQKALVTADCCVL